MEGILRREKEAAKKAAEAAGNKNVVGEKDSNMQSSATMDIDADGLEPSLDVSQGSDIFAQMMGGEPTSDDVLSSQSSDASGEDVDTIVRNRVQREIALFTKMRLAKVHTASDILDHYSDEGIRLPAHTLLMRENFTARGTSADVEGIFSRSGFVMGARRSSLCANNLSRMMMILCNRPLMPNPPELYKMYVQLRNSESKGIKDGMRQMSA